MCEARAFQRTWLISTQSLARAASSAPKLWQVIPHDLIFPFLFASVKTSMTSRYLVGQSGIVTQWIISESM
jgi:hypothetical protein